MKKTLNTLTCEELKKVWNTNEKIRNEYYEYIYSRNNDLLEEELQNLLGESKSTYEIRDNYNSFYIKVTDGIRFITSLDFKGLLERNIVAESLVSYYKRLYNDWYCADCWSSLYAFCEEKLIKLADKVASKIEEYLHEIENNIPLEKNACIDWIEEIQEEILNYEDVYITDNTYIAYSDYTKCYA
jgi:hypothetical protein